MTHNTQCKHYGAASSTINCLPIFQPHTHTHTPTQTRRPQAKLEKRKAALAAANAAAAAGSPAQTSSTAFPLVPGQERQEGQQGDSQVQQEGQQPVILAPVVRRD